MGSKGNWAAKAIDHAAPNRGIAPYAPETAASNLAWFSYQRRLDGVRAGMRELELWLRDMIHQGLAAAAEKSPSFWRQMADRLIDARAYETATEVRLLSGLPNNKPDWPVELLRRAGRLYLLTQGYSRYESLPSTSFNSGYRSLEQAKHAYGVALGLNPWLRHFPLLLHSMMVKHDGQRWSIRDENGYLMPLPGKTLIGWHLQRVTLNEKVDIFGEWDGRIFQPLTLLHDSRWIELHTLRDVK